MKVRRTVFLLILSSLFAFAPLVAREYPIGVGDTVEVLVAEMPSLNTEQIVAEDGSLTLPIVGKVEVAGSFADEVSLRIREILEDKGLRQATVRVAVAAYVSQTLNILGMVSEPGVYAVQPDMRLLDVIEASGGLKAEADKILRLRRRDVNGLADEIEIEVEQLITFGDPRWNIPVFAGDVIEVPRAETMTVCLVGTIENGCRERPAEPPITLMRLILNLGGLPSTASRKIIVRRLRPDGTRFDIEVSFKRIVQGEEPDFVLQDGDLIHVKEAFF